MPAPADGLLRRTTCPHCWEGFAPEDALWVAAHTDLRGDPRLGPDEPQRFLPTRFTVGGDAIDARGLTCTELACPRCHLSIPRAVLEMEPLFVSVLGTPASGKSFYLTALTRQLRQVLPRDFALAFSDADPAANLTLIDYEQSLFASADPLDPIELGALIEKTQTTQLGHYDTVNYGTHAISYPRPFVFALKPGNAHPRRGEQARLGRVLCLYDIAGEHCLPGSDTATSAATRHLAQSRLLLFLFDPLQHPEFRQACRDAGLEQRKSRETLARQEAVLEEAAIRVRRYTGLQQTVKHDRPLVVVVTKSDLWGHLLDGETPAPEPWVSKNGLGGIDLDRVDRRSDKLRALLLQYSPDIVHVAEEFAANVRYIGVSALGTKPMLHPLTGRPSVRPADIHPHWVAVPLLAGGREAMPGLVSRLKPRAQVQPSR